MDYQILVLDLDGTLTNSKKEITQPTLEALIEIQEAGKKVVLASGRPTQGVMPLAEQLHLEDYGMIERSLIVSEGERLDVADLPLDIQNAHYEQSDETSPDSFELSAMERRHIARVLEYTKGNKTEAARLLKIGLTTLYRKIEEYGI